MGKKKTSVKNINIVLLGNTGNGKSSAVKTIIGEKEILTEASANSVTTKCVEYTKGNITVIDTPDFLEGDDEQMKAKIVSALVECAGGIHAFVIVLKVGRYTRNEKKFLNMLKEDVLKHTVILFTFGDQLGKHKCIKEKRNKFVKTSPELEELVKKCGDRCHVIDNKYWKKEKNNVKRLLEIIHTMVGKNSTYSNQFLKSVEATIQEEMKKTNSPEKTQENAKENAYGAILKQVAGTATDVLFDAFLGDYGSNLTNSISKSLDKLAGIASAAGAVGIKGGGEVALASTLVSTGVTVTAALAGAVKARCKANNADSAMTSNENAKTLMESAQTALENAKTNLETATTKLKKIQDLTKKT